MFSLEIVEMNHNVSVWVKKIPSMMPQPRPTVLETVTCMTLLHSDDATRAKELHLSTSSLNGHQQVGFENIMTSKQLDEYCLFSNPLPLARAASAVFLARRSLLAALRHF